MVQTWPASSTDRRRVAAIALVAGGTAFGLFSEHVGFGLDDPARWMPDLLVGLAFLIAGATSLERKRGSGVLLALTGLTWWLGSLVPTTRFLHRGTFLHAITLYPGARPSTARNTNLLAVVYAFSVWPAVASSDLGTVAYGTIVLAIGIQRLVVSAGRLRSSRRTALGASIVVFAGSVGAVMIRFAAGGTPQSVQPALLLYEVMFAIAAILLGWGLREPSAASLANLVVDLGSASSRTLQDRLRRLVSDPMLEIGFRSEDGPVLGLSGLPVSMPDTTSDRVATIIERESGDDIVIVHDRSILQLADFVEAIGAVTRLSEENVRLNARAREQVDNLTSARQRLVTAESQEREKLAESIHDGPASRLAALSEMLDETMKLSRKTDARQSLERASIHLTQTRRDLDLVAEGLHPSALSGSLESAIGSLVAGTPFAVELHITNDQLPQPLKAAAYFLCAEALANATKHASATFVKVDIDTDDSVLRIVVSDDGVGGANPASGSGLPGLAERVEVLGGRLSIVSPKGAGTEMVAEIPLGDHPPTIAD